MQIPLQDKIAELETESRSQKARIEKLEREVKYLRDNTIPVIRHRISEEDLEKHFDEMDKEVSSAFDRIWKSVDGFFKKAFR